MALKKIGALWTYKNKSGESYLSGTLGEDAKKIKILVFKNTKGKEKNDKAPDFQIYEADDTDAPKGGAPASKSTPPAAAKKSASGDEPIF
jgi:uncharacterized protein (DUF736 family)